MTPQECKKRKFILQQCLINSIKAAVTLRAEDFYKKNVQESEKSKLRKDFAEAIIKAAQKIISSKANQTKTLIKAINGIKKTLKTHKKILAEGQPSFGVAQKALNLFLKYLWCLDIPNISQPPLHCPVDSQVLDEIKDEYRKEQKPWFHFSQKDYEIAIGKIQNKIKPESCAEWELRKWDSSLDVCIAPLFA